MKKRIYYSNFIDIEFEYYKRIKTKTTRKGWFYSTSIFVILFIGENKIAYYIVFFIFLKS
jgi:hypothetical protein